MNHVLCHAEAVITGINVYMGLITSNPIYWAMAVVFGLFTIKMSIAVGEY